MNKYNFDPVYARDIIVAQIRHHAKEQGFNRIVVGISGGKDSAITAALCARAIGKENVIGVLLPDNKQADIDDSLVVCQALGIPYTTFNIGSLHQALLIQASYIDRETLGEANNIHYVKEADINVPPRLRMTVLRYITQALDARLAGTGNLSEKTVGYCTKDGDTSCDFSVLGSLTSVEVVQVGLTMEELPKDVVLKTPSDGLSGVSDEEKLGVSYEDIHKYIRNLEGLDPEVESRIGDLRSKGAHKYNAPPQMYPATAPWGGW